MPVTSLRQLLVVDVRIDGLSEIWRRLRMPSDLPLARVHSAIQIAFGWADQHLHEFVGADGRRFGVPFEDEPGLLDQSSARLQNLLSQTGDEASYVYDFGDDWHHVLTVAEALPYDPEQATVRCLAGAKAGPPEDCGGPPGYLRLVEVLSDRAHPDYFDTTEWLGGYFFPELFDLDETNERLAIHLDRTWDRT